MDAASPRRRHAGSQAVASSQDAIQAILPMWLKSDNFDQAFVQDSQLVGHSVLPLRRYPGLMELVNCSRDSAGKLHSIRAGEECGGGLARYFALKPHLEAWNNADRFRHGNPVRA